MESRLLKDEEIINLVTEYHLSGKQNRHILARKVALAQDAKSVKTIIEWGNEPCVEHSKVEFPAEIGGGTVERQRVKRRRCQHCWQALKRGIDEQS